MLKIAVFSVFAVSLNFFSCPAELYAKPIANRNVIRDIELPSTASLTLKRTNDVEGRQNKVRLGQTYRYTLTVTNTGSQKATNIILSEDLSKTAINVEEIIVSHTEGTISYDRDRSKNIVIVHLGELLPKQQATIEFIVTPRGAGKDISESIVEYQESILPRKISTKTMVEPVKIDPHDLELTIATDNQSPHVGKEITLVVHLTNKGLGMASDIRVLISLPQELKLIDTDSSYHYGVYELHSSTWKINAMGGERTQSLKIRAKVVESGSFSTIAEVISAQFSDLDSIAGNGKNDEDDYSTLTFISR
ncbi:MAG: DUF11 domain-containing protein [Cyanobacteria bacterium J06643_13]